MTEKHYNLEEMDGEKVYRTYIELVTENDVDEFTNICKTVSEEVMIKGLDENGCKWEMSAKSLLNSLIMKEIIRNKKQSTAHNVDWNTIYVECERDIYSLISKFAK